jgi:two-component system sensor histidine kinase MtrB
MIPKSAKLALFALLVSGFSSVILGTFAYEISRGLLTSTYLSNDVKVAAANFETASGLLKSGYDPQTIVNSFPKDQIVFLEINSKVYGNSAINSSVIPSNALGFFQSHSVLQESFSYNGASYLLAGFKVKSNVYFYQLDNLQNLGDSIQAILFSIIGFSVFMTLLAVFLTLYARRSSLRPIYSIARTSERLSAADFNAKFETTDDADMNYLIDHLNRLSENVSKIITSESRFSHNVSHELRTPLSTLINATEVMRQKQNEFSPETKKAFDLLAGEVEHFSKLVTDLLELLKASTYDDLNLEQVNAFELVNNCLKPLGIVPDIVKIDDKVRDLYLLADKRAVQSIFSNLVENAKKYANGLTEISVDLVPGYLRLNFKDNGPGLDKEEKERIFERFYRGKASSLNGNVPGSGLGLSLVQNYVRLHKGILNLESDLGSGACFSVLLPLRSNANL